MKVHKPRKQNREHKRLRHEGKQGRKARENVRHECMTGRQATKAHKARKARNHVFQLLFLIFEN